MIAHRGASAYEPENSLAAFRAASALGADAVELDVHATADGAFVIHHDRHIGACTIPNESLERVQSCRLSNGEAIPTLSQALEVLGAEALVFVEIKSLPRERDAALFAALDAGPAPTHYHLHAFDHRIIRRLQRQRPALVFGALSASYPVDPFRPLAEAGATELWQAQELIDGSLIADAHERGYRVFAWTVDHPARMRALIDLGADGICTNVPDLARALIARR